jgi:PTH1 family peptidyl-tRNA hydrolase
MKWIVGLGNPEARYAGTAHNLGFDVVDILARRWGWTWRLQERMRAQTAEGPMPGASGGAPAMLVKPMTYMNLSGEALGLLMRQREVAGEEILAVTDDVNLPLGRLRVRPDGGPGGHNGLRSIIERLGREDFARLRIGIRDEEAIEDLAKYVLRKLAPNAREQLGEMCELAADAAECWLSRGVGEAADRYNGMRRFSASAGDEGTKES